MEHEKPPIRLSSSEILRLEKHLYYSGLFSFENLVPVFDFADSVTVEGKTYQVDFLVIGSSSGEEYNRIRPLLYPNTDVFMLYFDVTNRFSFDRIKQT